jgi:molybdopterin-guanine dinucleotide biosynthesis protein
MKIITVSGAHSGIGKTTLVENILKGLKNWSALKITVAKDGPCPRKISCGVCRKQNTAFSIISKIRTIEQKGKDTQRMKVAGAKEVLWLKARPSGLKDGLGRALKRFKDCEGVVIEGTSVLKYLKPDLGIFITGKGRMEFF